MSKMLDMRFSPAWKNKYVAKLIKNGNGDKAYIILDNMMAPTQAKAELLVELINGGIDISKIYKIIRFDHDSLACLAYAVCKGVDISQVIEHNYTPLTLQYIIRELISGTNLDDILSLNEHNYNGFVIRFSVILKSIGCEYEDILQKFKTEFTSESDYISNDIENFYDPVTHIFRSRVIEKSISLVKNRISEITPNWDCAYEVVPYLVNAIRSNDMDLLTIYIMAAMTFEYTIGHPIIYISRASKYQNFKNRIDEILKMMTSLENPKVYFCNLERIVKNDVPWSDIYCDGDSIFDVKNKLKRREKLLSYLEEYAL